MMNRLIGFLVALLLAIAGCSQKSDYMDLSGEWKVTIDTISGFVNLPGSLTENGIGKVVTDSSVSMLTEPYRYTGKAIFEREIIIPDDWDKKTIKLFMERTKVSEVFINDYLIGCENMVSVPHIYYIKDILKPGKNHLKIIIDNSKSLLPLGGSHAYSEHTQTNWNGILGEFYLKCIEDTEIRDLQVYPLEENIVDVKIRLFNSVKENRKEQFHIVVYNMEGEEILSKKIKLSFGYGISEHTISFELKNPVLWDEYNPYLYKLFLTTGDEETYETTFGIRNFIADGKQFRNNNRIVYLRGTHEGGVFPLTGYPSMKEEDWLRYFEIVKSYGINHVRFHSWCPSDAAFVAADKTGVFLQPELPLWGRYEASDTILINYMKHEGKEIMKAYGNHPSFVMFVLGNELEGDTAVMSSVVQYLRLIDSRHLYALGSNNFYWDPQTNNSEDFFVAMRNGKKAPDMSTDLRGSFSFADSNSGGIINCMKPNTYRDYSTAIKSLNKPVIGHETGQYQVYPDFKEVEKYTGVMKPLNFHIFKKKLKEKGMLDKADDFLKASGALSVLCYREEIEMALRTPGFGGFQLLDLQDYPGQGTALVGILNAFMDSKNIISREKWINFCNDVVPLARFEKYCWNNDEVFTSKLEIANYGKSDLKDQEIVFLLKDQDGNKLLNKVYSKDLIQGKLVCVDSVDFQFGIISHPQKLSVEISLSNTEYSNSWDIWVYPSYPDIIKEGEISGILVTRDKNIIEKEKKGSRKILYIPKIEDIYENSVGGLFTTDFWNYGVFLNVARSLNIEPSPGTMGLLIDNKHPVFENFPTDFHSNWQWWNIVKNSHPVILDHYNEDFFPVVQVVDNFERNHKLGLIYEMQSENPNILVCSSDLFNCKDEPEVKALFFSLINYLEKR